MHHEREEGEYHHSTWRKEARTVVQHVHVHRDTRLHSFEVHAETSRSPNWLTNSAEVITSSCAGGREKDSSTHTLCSHGIFKRLKVYSASITATEDSFRDGVLTFSFGSGEGLGRGSGGPSAARSRRLLQNLKHNIVLLQFAIYQPLLRAWESASAVSLSERQSYTLRHLAIVLSSPAHQSCWRCVRIYITQVTVQCMKKKNADEPIVLGSSGASGDDATCLAICKLTRYIMSTSLLLW